MEKIMKKTILILVAFVLATSAFGANNWTGNAGDGRWTTSANWTLGYPDTANQIIVSGDGQVVNVVDGDNITVNRMLWMDSAVYNDTTTTVNFTGGNFTCAGYWMVPNAITLSTEPNAGANINLSGEAYVQTASISLGIASPNTTTGAVAVAHLNITDNARMYVTATTNTNYRYTGFVAPGDLNKHVTVRVNITGSGTLEVNNLVVGASEDVVINVKQDGKLKVKGEKQVLLEGLITAGQVITDDNSTTPVITYDGTWTTLLSPNNTSLTKPNTPVPADLAAANTIVDLSWTPGNASNTWNLYAGTDSQNLGLIASGLTSPSYQLNTLDFGTTYYWRVDEMAGSFTITGDVWSFTTRTYFQVYWFENQAEIDAWTASNATLGLSTNPARGSGAMAFSYNNASSPYLSSATAAFPFAGNITCTNAVAMSVWIYGDAANADETMYVTLSDGTNQATVVCPIANVTQIADWTNIWNIDLRDFPAANPAIDMGAITTMTIGVGDPASPSAGGSGTIYIDNINLYPVRCIAQPATDLNDDCFVNLEDFSLMAAEWLANGMFPIL